MGSRVTFVIPCYNLGHLLSDCVTSILSQSFGDLDVLVMDDCSPDNTPEVARSFGDARVRWVRNEPNLGHLKNFNKGIGLAEGDYVWLISADDRLRASHAVERLVRLLDGRNDVGFAFSQAMWLEENRPGRLYLEHDRQYGPLAPEMRQDAIFPGSQFCCRLIQRNFIPTPAVLVRKACYEKYGYWPEDLPFAGDWFTWCRLALHHDVGYAAEPLADYRWHESNMTKAFHQRVRALVEDDIRVRWRIRKLAIGAGCHAVVRASEESLVRYYTDLVTGPLQGPDARGLTLAEFEDSLGAHGDDQSLDRRIRRSVYAAAGDVLYDSGDRVEAKRLYEAALSQGAGRRTWTKRQLMRLGPLGQALRDGVGTARRLGMGRWS